jgi:sensor domain CHASE-containing protein
MMFPEIPSAVLTAISAVGVAVVTAVGTVWVSRSKARVDVQSTINDGFSKLVEKLNESITEQDQKIKTLEVELEKVRKQNWRLLAFLRSQGLTPPTGVEAD